MNDFVTRVRTFLGSLVTWLIVIAAVLSVILSELADFADDPFVGNLIRYVGIALTVVTVAVSVVRRVTVVVEGDRGLLPIANPTPQPKKGM